MILVAGIADESPVARVIEALNAIGADYHVFDQRHALQAAILLRIADASGGGALTGSLCLGGDSIPLDTITGMYVRVMDDQLLPCVTDLGTHSPQRMQCRRLHELFLRFADIAPGRVLNRPSDMTSNQSKPFQAQLIRAGGFDIPDTLITNTPSVARAFIEAAWFDGGEVVYKSMSGIRSIVQRVTEDDLARLDRIRWCPTQFQRRVDGTDIRVHVVGRTVIATSIESDAADYRYATRQTGIEPTITHIELAPDVRARCVTLAERFALPLAGIDLRRTPEGRYVCFEVNPSPAFTYYEERAGVSIAPAIARYLAGDAD